MNPDWTTIIPWIGTVIAAFLSGIWIHGLTMRRDSETRRRKFRDTMNEISANIRAHQNTGLGKTYLDTRPTVRIECVRIKEDIHWWNQRGFKRATERYLTLTEQETDPYADPTHMTDIFTVDQRQARFDSARALMGNCLDRIVHYAR